MNVLDAINRGRMLAEQAGAPMTAHALLNAHADVAALIDAVAAHKASVTLKQEAEAVAAMYAALSNCGATP